MAKISFEFETKFDRGDVVIFDYHGCLRVGVISGFYIDSNANNSIWYDIVVGENHTLNYTNGGDVMEEDILGTVGDPEIVKKIYDFIQKGEWSDSDVDNPES